ncbi:MAG: glycosyltransferase family 4 protein [Mangrovibacterium sp.]
MICILFFIILFLFELAYFKLAGHFNIIDKPNQRSSHSRITLRGGGVIFYLGVLLYFFWSGFAYPWFFTGLTLIALISFADDVKPRSSCLRLVVHFVAMSLMFYQWNLFQMPWYFTLIALIISTGILNAYNFMDGINGITGGYSLVVLGAFWFINLYRVPFVDNRIILLSMLALLVYNFFNFRTRARCFAGDVGAISIAFIVVFLLGLLMLKTGDIRYILLLAVYGVDSVCTIIHRLMLRENIFEAHRKHAYQLMANELKIPHVLVSSLYMVLQAFIAAGLLLVFPSFRWFYFTAVLGVLGVLYVLLMRKYFKLNTIHN